MTHDAAPRGPAGPPGGLTLAAGSVLMVATGFLDAYTYLRQGHVFAQAMTGNLVLVAVGAAQPDVVAFWRPLSVYAAFLVGVAATWVWSRVDALARPVPPPQLATLALQVGVLLVVGAVAGAVPSAVVAPVIAFVAGMQIAAFRDVGPVSFTTTVMTTNSMRTAGAVLDALASRDGAAVAAARTYGTALAGFVTGAVLGAAASAAAGDRAAWAGAALFATAAALHVRDRRRPG